MPMQIVNPYQAQTPIGAGMQNIAQAMFGGATPNEIADREADIAYKNAMQKKALADTRKTEMEMEAPKTLADAVGRAYGPLYRNLADSDVNLTRDQQVTGVFPDIVGALAGAGKTGDIGALFNALMSNAPDSSMDARRRSAMGAGKPLSLSDEQGIAFSMLPPDRQALAVGPSEGNVKADILLGLPEPDQRIAALGQPGYGANESQVQGSILNSMPRDLQRQVVAGRMQDKNYRLPSGEVVRSSDGLTYVDPVNGQVRTLPSNAPLVSYQGDPKDVASTVQKDAARVLSAGRDIKYNTGRLREIITPTNIGAVGGLKNFVGGSTAQAAALATLLNGKAGEIIRDLSTTVDPNDPVSANWFDPSVGRINLLQNSLAYDIARLRDPGGKISDRDFQAARQSVGDNMMVGPEQIYAILDEIDLLAEDKMRRAQEDMGQQPSGIADVMAPPAQQQPQRKVIRFDSYGNQIR